MNENSCFFGTKKQYLLVALIFQVNERGKEEKGGGAKTSEKHKFEELKTPNVVT